MGVVLEVRVFPLIAAVTPMTVGEYSCRWIQRRRPTAGMGKVGKNDIGRKFDRPLWLMVSSVCRQTMGTSGTCNGLVNS